MKVKLTITITYGSGPNKDGESKEPTEDDVEKICDFIAERTYADGVVSDYGNFEVTDYNHDVEILTPRLLWEVNEIQFPRLLAEIRAVGLNKKQYAELGESMDLNRDEVDELLERAEEEWQDHKNKFNRG